MTFGYHLDRSDTNVSVLRRLDGSVVADFGTARGAAFAENVVEAAEKDYRDLFRTPRRG